MSAKQLGQASLEGLAERFNPPVTPDSQASVTPVVEGIPAPRSKRPAAKKKTRPAPVGMVRRSVYTRQDALDALMEAADRVVAGTNGFSTKAEAIAELILAGVNNEDQVLGVLRDRLRERFDA